MKAPGCSSLLVVADDATGALECGAILADAGCSAQVLLDAAPAGVEPAVAMWPGRHLPHEEVEESLGRFWEQLGRPAASHLYWKTDSTLRGPIGASFQTLLRLKPGHAIVFCPAYPAMGRTVREGVLCLDGVPLAQTEFARDARTPVRHSSVAASLQTGYRGEVRHASNVDELRSMLDVGGVIVCDGQSEEAVSECHRVCRESNVPLIMAGPAGGIRHWCGSGGGSRREWPRVERWRVVCGSRHPVSLRQAEAARAMGLEVFATPESDCGDPQAAVEELARTALRGFYGGLLVFGGDTTLALCREMQVSRLQPLGECVAGVAVSLAAGERVLVTKAGGFGEENIAARILRQWGEG